MSAGLSRLDAQALEVGLGKELGRARLQVRSLQQDADRARLRAVTRQSEANALYDSADKLYSLSESMDYAAPVRGLHREDAAKRLMAARRAAADARILLEQAAADEQRAKEIYDDMVGLIARRGDEGRGKRKARRSTPSLSRPAGQRTVARAVFALEFLGAMVSGVSARINEEEVGDAIEKIRAMAARGFPKWAVYTKVVVTFGLVGWHVALEQADRVADIIRKVMGKGDDDK